MVEMLLDPNVAYLLLLAFFWFGLAAAISPGTGLLEVATVFALILAGVGVYNLPINWWALGLLFLVALPLLLLVFRTGKLVFLALSILALVLGSSFLFRGEGWVPAVHPVLALVASTISAGYYWILTQKSLEAIHQRPRHELAALIGAAGETRTPVHEYGSVQVAGELWSARSQVEIPEGMKVRVIGRDGFTLLVEPVSIPGELSPNP